MATVKDITNLTTLDIYEVTEEQYEALLQSSEFDPDAIYLTPNSGGGGSGTVTSVEVSNATNGGLSISGSPITSSGTISIGHSNVLSSAQTTSAVYPIKIDKNGHISEYGSAVTTLDIYEVTEEQYEALLQSSEFDPDAIYLTPNSGGGGTPTDVQINGTSITNDYVANILTNSAYDSSTNKIATMADVPAVTNSYSSTGTTAVTGTAVNAALQTLDSSITASTGQAISAITITDGKITNSSKINVGEANTVTDVQVNGTSILSSKVANLVTNTAYNSSSNKIATMSDVPSAGTSASAVGTTASGGSATTWSKSDHVHNITSSTITSALGFTPATSTHVHGDINNAGTVTSTAVTPGNGDYILITDSSDSTANKVKRGIAIGTGTSKYLREDGTWQTVSASDTKQAITLATTTKTYVTGVSTTPTGTAQALTGLADTGVYLTTTAGQLNATTYKVNEAVTLQYNSTTKSLDFIFS